MERVIFGKSTLNAPRPRLDRFVAPRESFPELEWRRGLWGARCNLQNDDIWCKQYQQKKRYMNYIDSAFGLDPPKALGGNEEAIWPCVPRKKPYLSSADSILDLPTYSYAPFPELLDWSNENILVAALGRSYHKWSWRTQNLISEGYTQYDILCCKFDPCGELLALGTTVQVELHDNVNHKLVTGSICPCSLLGPQPCSISAVEWSPTGKSFVTGCSRGTLAVFDRQSMGTISWRRAFHMAVLTVRVSPDARYLAAAAVNGDCVLLFTWPCLSSMCSIVKSAWSVKALAWHPWRSALLSIGTVLSTLHVRIALIDAPTARIREALLGHTPYSLDAMLFSHRTGEMVLSLCDTARPTSPKGCSKLVVMSDPDTVVDQWRQGLIGLDRVRTMIFSPDGTKLATATADEDLIIWNFLPEVNKKKKRKRFSDIPVFLEEATYGYSRGNAASILGTLPAGIDMDQLSYL